MMIKKNAETAFEGFAAKVLGKIEIGDDGLYTGLTKALYEISVEVALNNFYMTDDEIMTLCLRKFLQKHPEVRNRGEYELQCRYNAILEDSVYTLVVRFPWTKKNEEIPLCSFRGNDINEEDEDEFWKIADSTITDEIGFDVPYDLVLR